jgi:cytochrome oxidase assembly protein ShyY1
MLRQRRFVILTLVVLLVSVLCVFLGRWQWHRHVAKRTEAMAAEAALANPAEPVSSLLPPQGSVGADLQFRLVTVTGTYDAQHQVLWRNPRGGGGYDVITPLVPTNGTALLIDRGWVPYSLASAETPAADVTPPTGNITVTTRLQPSALPDNRAAPTGQVYVVSVQTLAAGLPYPLYDGYGELVTQDPAPDSAFELSATDVPSLGPHLLYAYQWWIFAIMAWIGLFLLLRREAQDQAALAAQQDDPESGLDEIGDTEPTAEEPSPTAQHP